MGPGFESLIVHQRKDVPLGMSFLLYRAGTRTRELAENHRFSLRLTKNYHFLIFPQKFVFQIIFSKGNRKQLQSQRKCVILRKQIKSWPYRLAVRTAPSHGANSDSREHSEALPRLHNVETADTR